MNKYLLIVIGLFSTPHTLLSQSVTIKLQANPVYQLEDQIPLSAGSSLEVGVSRKSSIQVTANYRLFSHTEAEPDRGAKFYLDYRYYINPKGQSNAGWYVSPFLGYGKLKLGRGDEAPPSDYSYRLLEKEAGMLLGWQPFGNSRFTFDLFIGPVVQRQTNQRVHTNGDIDDEEKLNRLWLRGGYNISFRIIRRKS
jgi:hypothetical protein